MKTSLRILLGLSRAAAVLALATSVGGCVAAKHYDEARSVAESEIAGHARTRARLAAALARLDGLEKELQAQALTLSAKQHEVDAGESVVAASKLETTVAVTEKRAAGELVDQLRSELARTGDHLRIYSHDKRDLEQALLLAEQRLRGVDAASKSVAELVAASRDLSLGLGDLLLAGDVSLGAREGGLALAAPGERLFAAGETTLGADAAVIVAAVARTAAAHPSLRVVVRQPGGTALGAARSESLILALREGGIPNERLALVSQPAEPTAPAPVADAVAPLAPAAAPDKKPDSQGDASAAASPKAVESVPDPVPAPERYEIAFAP